MDANPFSITAACMPGYNAQREKHLYKITDAAYEAWRGHMYNAKRRGIPFHFTLLQWYTWWRLMLSHGGKRGLSKDNRLMCRYLDRGPYAPGNVYCGTPKSNKEDWKAAGARRYLPPENVQRPHLGKRGFNHPKSRAVLTPQGCYGSAALAAEAYGVTRQTAARWARQQRYGWHYDSKPRLDDNVRNLSKKNAS